MRMMYQRSRGLIFSVLVLIVLGWMAGCGGGGGSDFSPSASVNSTTSTASTANPALTFTFAKARTDLSVPTGTTQLKFSFFSSDNGVGAPLFEVIRPFATSITIELTDDRARSVTVTALDVNSVPVLESTVGIPANIVQDFAVDFAAADTSTITLNSIGITPFEGTLAVGEEQSLSATLNFSDGSSMPGSSVTWSVTGQGTITPEGVLTGSESGQAFVTAEYNGVKGEATFNVGEGPSLQSLVIMPSGTFYVPQFEVQYFTVEGRDQNGNPIEAGDYTLQIVTNNSGARLGDNKTAFEAGSREGTDTVRISAGGLSVLQDIIVGDDPALTIDSITVNGPNPLLLTAAGQTSHLTATATFLDGHQEALPTATNPIVFTSLDSRVATFLNSGVVTAVTQGATDVRAITSGKNTTITVKVDYGANNAAPTIALDTDVLQFRNEYSKLTLSATVTDDQLNFDGGKLIVSEEESGDVTDAQFSISQNAPSIGTVNATDTRIEVALDQNSTPDKVATFLRNISIRRHDTSGRGTVNVELQDRDANDPNMKSGTGSRNFESVITVGPGGRYPTIAFALGVAEGQTSKNPIILAYAGLTPEYLFLYGGFDSLTLYGANRGISAGVQPAGESSPTRGPETILKGIDCGGLYLTLDGLTISGNDGGVILGENPGQETFATVRNCRFVGPQSNNVTLASEVGPGTEADYSDCLFQNWSIALLENHPGGSFKVLRNRFEGNFRDIDLSYLTTSLIIQGNSFHESLQTDNFPGYHLYVEDGSFNGQDSTTVYHPGDISGNDFTGNGRVSNFSDTTNLVVEGNWWGQAGGPLPTQTSVFGAGSIDADPAADGPFTNGAP